MCVYIYYNLYIFHFLSFFPPLVHSNASLLFVIYLYLIFYINTFLCTFFFKNFFMTISPFSLILGLKHFFLLCL